MEPGSSTGIPCVGEEDHAPNEVANCLSRRLALRALGGSFCATLVIRGLGLARRISAGQIARPRLPVANKW